MREHDTPARPASFKLSRLYAFVCTCVLVAVPMPAGALEISGGVSFGGILIGPDPRLAVSPNLAMSWRLGGSAVVSVHEHLNLLPAVTRLGVGVYSQTSAAVGYAWAAGNISIGPTFSIYDMPACGALLCGRVVGVGSGVHAQLDVYFAGSLGASVSANLDWLGGSSALLPGGVAAMVFAGPVFRWRPKPHRSLALMALRARSMASIVVSQLDRGGDDGSVFNVDVTWAMQLSPSENACAVSLAVSPASIIYRLLYKHSGLRPKLGHLSQSSANRQSYNVASPKYRRFVDTSGTIAFPTSGGMRWKPQSASISLVIQVTYDCSSGEKSKRTDVRLGGASSVRGDSFAPRKSVASFAAHVGRI